jgi:uncharacterized protein (TIGR00159 family)
MLEGLLHLFSRRAPLQVFIDVVDLLVVAYVVYRALLVLRGTRAMQMGMGLGVIFLVYVVSKWAGFITLFNLLSGLLSSIILVVVVVFQNDIRRGLMRVGSRAFFGGMGQQQESRVIDEVVAAATELARHRIGALVCFEQDANLDEFVVSHGTSVDAAVQRDLLVSLFVPESLNRLHDGAVVIRNLRIAKAGVFFPMPDTRVLDKSLGSRHRAALGITEETDAVVVVVSEERGTISFCFNGNIVSNLDGASLRQALLGLFGQRTRKKKPTTKRPPERQTGSYRISVPPPGGVPTGVTPIEPVRESASFKAAQRDVPPDEPSVRLMKPTPIDPVPMPASTRTPPREGGAEPRTDEAAAPPPPKSGDA